MRAQEFPDVAYAIKNFGVSNGTAAISPTHATGRQGNLIVTSTQPFRSALRQKLIDEVKRQGKPYGLYFDDIQGGFTLTTRQLRKPSRSCPWSSIAFTRWTPR